MIKLYDFDSLKPEEILNRDIRAEKNVEDVVDAILADVRTRGDEALKEYALKFDGAEIENLQVTQEEIELIALCVMAEAEGECEYGQRLVIDVILNRVDDPHFPDTIYDVIYQKNQFAGMYGDRITRCYVKDELVQLVREVLENRTEYDVVFFRTGHYHSYGVPKFQVGAHYFSSYE